MRINENDMLVAFLNTNLQNNLFALKESIGYRQITKEEYEFVKPMLLNTLERINSLIPGCEESVPSSVFRTESDLKRFLQLG